MGWIAHPERASSQPAWMEDAACRGMADPDPVFYNPNGHRHAAKAICRGCPVRMRCLEYALEIDERFGVWGGLSTPERDRLKRARQAS